MSQKSTTTKLNQSAEEYEYDTALVDADVLRYEMGAITTTHPFLDTARVPAAADFVIQRLEEKIARIKEATGCSKLLFVFSGKGNFRFSVAASQKYKGNRADLEKPFHWSTVDQYLKETYEHIVINDREADDYLAERQRVSRDTIICTRDKDLLVTPGWHYRWSCGDRQPEVPPHFVTEFTAWRNFFYQMLIGDNTDNIPGCGERKPVIRGGKEVMWRHGIGPKTAQNLLRELPSIEAFYHQVRLCYAEYFPFEWEEKMLENARLLFVGQSADNLFDWDWLYKERLYD